MKTRTVGIDLAIKHSHEAFILDEAGQPLGRSFSFPRTFDGFSQMLKRALKGLAETAKLTVVMEPTSLAWVPLAVFLVLRGHKIYLVNPRRVADLRKFYSRHKKSDRIDAKVLAKLPVIDKETLTELYLAPGNVNALKRYCQQRDKLEKSIAIQKNRIQAVFTEANPTALEAFGGDKFTQVARAFLRYYLNPLKVKGLGIKRFTKILARKAHGELNESIAAKLFESCCDTIAIYQGALENDTLPFNYEELQDEVNLELDLMEYKEAQVKKLDKKISQLYQQLDPRGEIKSIKGIGDVHAPIILGFAGDINRYHSGHSYCGSTGLVPGKKQTGGTDRKGLSITKEGPNLLKKTYYMAAETARHWDVEMAERYYRLTGRGLHHKQAICAIGRSIAARAYAIMKRMDLAQNGLLLPEEVPYQLRDLEGKQISAQKARELILIRYPSKAAQRKKRGRAATAIKYARQSFPPEADQLKAENSSKRLESSHLPQMVPV